MEKRYSVLSVEQALEVTRPQMVDYHKEYVNTSLISLMGLVDFLKQYVKAKGTKVWDSEGKEYIDFLGAYGALNLGHNPPEILDALARVREYPNLLQVSPNTFAGVLAKNIAEITPGNLQRSFFCNSGAEAVEGALKLARIVTGKVKIISCEGSFHGKTIGALSVTGREKYKTPYGPLLPGCEVIPFGDIEALEEKLKNKDVAAFIVEPIQGEGGVQVPPEGYLKGAFDLCEKYGAMFIDDEIQTGMARTGKMFACEYEGFTPHIMCLAKALGGGVMPIGATVTTDEIWKKAYGTMEKATLHTSTFGGNTLACVAGIASIDTTIKLNLDQSTKEKGDYFIEKLKMLKEKYPQIKDVRGKGLLIGVEFEKPVKGILDKLTGGAVNKLADEYLGAMVAGNLLNGFGIITAYTLNNPNVIRMEPPLTVSYEELDYVVDSIDKIFQNQSGFLGVAASSVKTVVKGLFKK